MTSVSAAGGLKSGQSNRRGNSRMTNVECQIKEFFLFYLLKRAERSDIHNSSIIIRYSMKFHMSYMVSGIKLREHGVCMRFNLILFVLVLVLVLEKRKFVRRLFDTHSRTRTI
jgi:hypothetical protein